MAKSAQQAYQEMTNSINTYASNKVSYFIKDNDLVNDTFQKMIEVGIVDVNQKEVIYNLDSDNAVLRFYYIDNGNVVKVVLDNGNGNLDYKNIKVKPYLISANGKMKNGNNVIDSVDIFYSNDLKHSINIENPNVNNVNFALFISKL